MKKILEKIEKDDLIIFILIFFCSIGISLNLLITSSDEIWNFQNVYKIYNGFEIYKDINVIITPLFFWIANIIFHIFGANLFVFRISHCFVIVILYLFMYKVLKKLKVPKAIAISTIFMLMLQQFFIIIRTSFNYNNMALMFAILGIYLLINNKKNWIVQSFMSVIIFLTKQNIGIYYIIANLIYMIIVRNEKAKNKIKKILKYIGVIFLLMICFVVNLLINDNLLDFLNYAIGGICEFANENLLIEKASIVYMLGIILLNIVINITVLKKKCFSKEQEENIKILFIFSLMFSLIAYPIFNWPHVIEGVYISIINVVYVVYNIFKDFEKIIVKVSKIFNCIIIFIILLFSTYNLLIWKANVESPNYQYSWENPFFGGIIEEEEYYKNEEVTNYIKNNNKNVIVLSNRAALYMIPLKRNNEEFDLPFKGNLGIKGEKGLIEKINSMKDTIFLINENESKEYYQEVVEAKEYIKNNKIYKGKIDKFSIYE